jgi:protein-disulfide isomerase
VLEKYPHNVKVVFKNFPIRSHPFAVKAAAAALAAGSQGKFWEFHDLLFENYNRINDQKIQDIALSLNLDQVEFEKKMNDPEIQQKIGQDVMDGRQAGVNSTPSVFINGRLLRNRTLTGFEEVIDKELEKLKK